MRKILFLLLSGLQACTIMAQSGYEPYILKSLADASIQQVDVQTSEGNISVTGVSAGEARLEIYIRGNHRIGELSKEEIGRRLEELYNVTLSTNDHKLRVIIKTKHGNMSWRKGLNISIEIYVPEAVSTLLRTSGGNIMLKNLTGSEQDFKTSGGNLEIDGLTGKITGKTSGGNILLRNSKEDLDLSTSGGNIDASHCHGHIRLFTSGGNLDLRLLDGDIRASTSGGNVEGEEIQGELSASTSGGNVSLRDLSCSLQTSTSGGNINVSLRTLGKYLTVSNSSGDIDLQLPANKGVDLKVNADRVRAAGLRDFKGETDEKHITGSAEGGGVPVKVDGGSGRVNLSFK